MSMLLMVKAMEFKVGNPLRKLVLIKLADNANDKGECFPSHNTIAKACEISRSSVQAHIEALIKMGVVKKINRKKNEKENTSNLYILTIPANGIGVIPEDNTGIPVAGTPIPTDNIGGIPTDEQEPVSIEPVNESKKINKKDLSSSNDIQTEIKPKNKKAKYDYQGIIEAYRDVVLDGLPVPDELNAKRKTLINKLAPKLKNAEASTFKAYFARFMDLIENNPFYFGGENRRAWKATFDYVLRIETLTKVKEDAL
ncbi:helix-turn-helix domain-containing protein [Orbus sturtevantii]|uniref:helix-turn-helix domain-containing protein n=1 Tax=Orbus sturtevantii TaxID=3074109 RepID=UPI00370DCFDA